MKGGEVHLCCGLYSTVTHSCGLYKNRGMPTVLPEVTIFVQESEMMHGCTTQRVIMFV